MPPSTTATTTSFDPAVTSPRPKQIDVGSGDGIGHRSVVGIVPLLRKPRIVERQRGGSRRGRQRSRDGPLGPDTPDRIDRLDALDPFEPRQIERRPRHGTQRIEPDVVPAIQSGTARARLEAARRREDALHPRDAERRDGAVQRLGTRLQPAAGLDDPLRNLSLFELDAKAPPSPQFPATVPPTGCGASSPIGSEAQAASRDNAQRAICNQLFFSNECILLFITV